MAIATLTYVLDSLVSWISIMLWIILIHRNLVPLGPYFLAQLT
jgi:hypothetical protein